MSNIMLSVLIPARNEEFLDRTIQDVLQHSRGNTEVIAILDGYLPDPPLTYDSRVTIIYNPVAIGQRGATNQAAKIAKGKYLMKLDAHCALDDGFDVKMLKAFEELGDDCTIIPGMRNLHCFDWVCEEGHRRYQGNSGNCETCGKPTKKDIVWIPKKSPFTFTFRFDKTMHFQYLGELAKDPRNLLGSLTGVNLSFDARSVPSGIIDFLADFADSHLLTTSRDDLWFRQNMPMYTVSLSPVDSRRSIGTEEILGVGNKFQVKRITTSPVITEVINDQNISTSTSGNFANQPSISDTVCEFILAQVSEPSIAIYGQSSDPLPALGGFINADIVKKLNSVLGGEFIYNEKTKSLHNKSVTLTPIFDNMYRETLSIQGSCFMLTKEKYFELDICSEEFHSWGQQGVEVACKTWLSGGRVISNINTWYAHMFRTKGGDFGFPYPNPQSKVHENRELSRQLFMKDQWPQATRKFQWLLDKFNPPDWGTTKGIIYYTHNELDEKIAQPVRNRLEDISHDKKIDIVSSSLKKMNFGVKNVRFPTLKRGYLALFKQILGALENSKADIIFFTEHDVLYHPSHFDFEPTDKNTFYYNQNVWYLRQDGHAMHYDVNQLSGLCVYREAAITHFRERYERLQKEEFTRNMGFEPFTHNRVQWKNNFKMDTWKSEFPNIDIRFGENSTGMRWNKEEYRNQQLLINWQETDDTIAGWGRTIDIVKTLQ